MPAVAGIHFDDRQIHLCLRIGDRQLDFGRVHSFDTNSAEFTDLLFDFVDRQCMRHHVKIIGIGLTGPEYPAHHVASLFWKRDAEPFVFETQDLEGEPSVISERSMNRVREHFLDPSPPTVDPETREVIIKEELVSAEDYMESDPAGFGRLLRLSNLFRGKGISYVSATAQGGGVALMRHALIRLFRLLGVDAHWYVLKPNESVFQWTKRGIHNIIQNVFPEKWVPRTPDVTQNYTNWIRENADMIWPRIKNSSVIVIDDPQPSLLVEEFRKRGYTGPIIFRWHIQLLTDLIKKKGSAQNKVYRYISENARKSDLFVFHPIREFVPHDVPADRRTFMGATSDRIDGLGKEMPSEEISWWLSRFNEFLENIPADERAGLLDLDRPYDIQIARFDPSKGIENLLASHLRFRELLEQAGIREAPQLVLVGHGSIDDPDGTVIYDQVLETLKMKNYESIRDDVIVARLPHRILLKEGYHVSTDPMLNALLSGSRVALQLSLKEGFEVKVTEALDHGKPVVAFAAGGIPLQIKDKINGFLVPVGDNERVARELYRLSNDPDLYSKMSQNARELRGNNFTVQNAVRWLALALGMIHENSSFLNRELDDPLLDQIIAELEAANALESGADLLERLTLGRAA
jgi:glycosyltransferase involved in cell wall biosynthesis